MNDPETIYLQPECCADPAIGRLWCEDDAPETCEDGVPWTKYVLAHAGMNDRELLRRIVEATETGNETAFVDAMSEARAALAHARQQQSEPITKEWCLNMAKLEQAFDATRQQSEPVGKVVAAVRSENDPAMIQWTADYRPTVGDLLYAAPVQQQSEPVAWMALVDGVAVQTAINKAPLDDIARTHEWEVVPLYAAPVQQSGGSALAAPAQQEPLHDNKAAVMDPHPMLSATHFCRDCRALWRQCDDFTFNLRSTQCCDKCNNAPVGDQLIPLTATRDRSMTADAYRQFESEPVAKIGAVERWYGKQGKAAPVQQSLDEEGMRLLREAQWLLSHAVTRESVDDWQRRKFAFIAAIDAYRAKHEQTTDR